MQGILQVRKKNTTIVCEVKREKNPQEEWRLIELGNSCSLATSNHLQ